MFGIVHIIFCRSIRHFIILILFRWLDCLTWVSLGSHFHNIGFRTCDLINFRNSSNTNAIWILRRREQRYVFSGIPTREVRELLHGLIILSKLRSLNDKHHIQTHLDPYYFCLIPTACLWKCKILENLREIHGNIAYILSSVNIFQFSSLKPDGVSTGKTLM